MYQLPRKTASRSVGTELKRLFRIIAALIFVLLCCNAGERIDQLAYLRPQVQRLNALDDQLAQFHAGLVDEETGLRGFLATGQPRFLQPYRAAVPLIPRATARMSTLVPGGRLSRDLVTLRLAQMKWSDQWAALAADPARSAAFGSAASGRVDISRLTSFVGAGKVLFDSYRRVHDRFAADIKAALSRAESRNSDWLASGGVVEAAIAGFAVLVVFGVSRRLRRLVAMPIASLARTVAEIRAGNLAARAALTEGTAELLELGADVDEMAATLQVEADAAERREAEATLHSDRLSLLVGVARDVAGSLNLAYVLDAVAAAACRIGATRARVWLVEPAGERVSLAFDTAATGRRVQPDQWLGIGIGSVGRAAMFGRPVGAVSVGADQDESVVAVPMVIGGRVVGVLECERSHLPNRGPEPDADIMIMLEALAGQAAGSVEAARLHEYTRELSVTDPLTNLSNRRAFDEAIDAEVSRAIRYGRPLSVIYLDLDHFKELNDRYGHDCGDLALQRTAKVLQAGLRDTDRCYRLGGEELIIVAPETHALQAFQLAERLRSAVARVSPNDVPPVTASFGVAELPRHAMDGPGLVRAADHAVYAAKAAGRNRVALAVDDQPAPADLTVSTDLVGPRNANG